MSFGNALSLDVIFSFAATSSALSTLTPSAAGAPLQLQWDGAQVFAAG